MRSLKEKLYRFFSRIFRREIIRDGFHGVLGRDPEEETQKAYEKRFKELGTEGLIKELSGTTEAWEKQKRAHPVELIRDAYLGVLGREPEEKGLKAYGAIFKELGTSGVIRELSGSSEAWRNTIHHNIEKIIKIFYKGALEREADLEGLTYYSNLFNNKEYIENPEIILRELCNSQESIRKFLLIFDKKNPNEKVLKKETPIFIHIQKTAGTSLKNMLREIYGEKLYSEYADTLHGKPPCVLSEYECFAGHFNYDSLRYIPHSKKRLITFIRNPKERLISLYHFLRSHAESHPIHKIKTHDNGAALANKYMIHEFFENKELINQSGFWNHMTWAIMGNETWLQWKSEMSNSEEAEWNVISESKREIINQRIREFFFIGTQENFDECCKTLFLKLGRSYSNDIRRDHSIEKIAAIDPHFKLIERQIYDDRLDCILDKYTTLDKIIHEESINIKTQ